jgi:hypothetical protein
MRYYILSIDVYYPNRWYLGEIDEVENNWDFMSPNTAPNSFFAPFTTSISWPENGKDFIETDYTDGGYAFVQYLSEKARDALCILPNASDQLDFYPVNIKNYLPAQPYYVMVIKQSPLCVDEDKSDYDRSEQKYGAAAMERGFLSIYPAFYKLIIDPSRTNDLDIFRLGGCRTYIIVSERLKAAWEQAGLTGATFRPVTD